MSEFMNLSTIQILTGHEIRPALRQPNCQNFMYFLKSIADPILFVVVE